MEFVPLWQTDAALPDGVTSEAPPAEADVVVVGAGFTGLCAARAITRSPKHVVVIDAGKIGGGASSINGGMVNIGLKAPAPWMLERFGDEIGRAFWEASLAAIDLVEEVVCRERIECHFTRNGAAKLGHRARDLVAFRRSAAWMRSSLNFDVDVVGPEEIASVVGSNRFRAALVDSVGAGLHPRCLRLRAGCRRCERGRRPRRRRCGEPGGAHRIRVRGRHGQGSHPCRGGVVGYQRVHDPAARASLAAPRRAGRFVHHRHRAPRRGAGGSSHPR